MKILFKEGIPVGWNTGSKWSRNHGSRWGQSAILIWEKKREQRSLILIREEVPRASINEGVPILSSCVQGTGLGSIPSSSSPLRCVPSCRVCCRVWRGCCHLSFSARRPPYRLLGGGCYRVFLAAESFIPRSPTREIAGAQKSFRDFLCAFSAPSGLCGLQPLPSAVPVWFLFCPLFSVPRGTGRTQ